VEQRKGGLGVCGAVERRNGAPGSAGIERFAAVEALGDELGVLLLNVRGVSQHGRAEVDGSGRRVNGAGKAVLHQRGRLPLWIDVGVERTTASM